MSFQKTIQKSGVIARLEHQIETMEQVEVRHLLVLACYEAEAGPLDPELLRRTNDMLHGKQFKTRQEMYNAALNSAKTVRFELDSAQPEAASTPGTGSIFDQGIPLSLSDSTGTPED